MHHTGPFTIPEIRSFVPEKLKPWIYLLFFLIYQFSGGVYMAAASEMSGSLALMREDVMMAGYASLVGLALTFTIMYRFKFRFSAKTSFLVTACGLIVCNLICMHTGNVPVLVATCFLAGIFRMWGTFACNSAIQIWVTPKRDMAVWFCYIQMCVHGFLQLSGLTTIYIAFLSKWEYMHWFIIGMLLVLILITWICCRHYMPMKKLPLFGIDWMGFLLWAATILCIIFVLNYGEYYDWFHSVYIRTGTVFGLAALALNVWRASFIRHPYIANETWRFRNVWLTLLLFVFVNILVSPSHIFEHAYTEQILAFDALHIISLNWLVLLGTVLGAAFAYYVFAMRKWKYKTMSTIGFASIVGYLLMMYSIIDYRLPKEMLYFPIVLRGFGYIIIGISFITALSVLPFKNFFQSLSIQGFMSACCGSLIGSAVLVRVFKSVMARNSMLLGANLDRLNPIANHLPSGAVWGSLQSQAMMVSMKEIYGWLCLLGIFCLLAFFLRESSLHPKFSSIRRAVRLELKRDGGKETK